MKALKLIASPPPTCVTSFKKVPYVKVPRGQSYKTTYTLGQIYKLILKLDNMFWLRKYLVRILELCTLKYSKSNFFSLRHNQQSPAFSLKSYKGLAQVLTVGETRLYNKYHALTLF